jgi:hypothetical protein
MVVIVVLLTWLTRAASSVPGAAPLSPTGLRFGSTAGVPLRVRGRTYVWCGKWDDGARVRTLRIQQSSLLTPPWWFLEIRLAIARRGQTVAFPQLTGRNATMFVGSAPTHLETSAESEGSRGSMVILGDVSCRPGSRVRIRVRAHLASEEAGGRSVEVDGTFVGRVGSTPAPGVQP